MFLQQVMFIKKKVKINDINYIQNIKLNYQIDLYTKKKFFLLISVNLNHNITLFIELGFFYILKLKKLANLFYNILSLKHYQLNYLKFEFIIQPSNYINIHIIHDQYVLDLINKYSKFQFFFFFFFFFKSKKIYEI